MYGATISNVKLLCTGITWIFSFSTHILSSDLSMPYAKAAAVGSLITLRTFSPAIWPASLVAYEKGNGALLIISIGNHIMNLRVI